MEGVPTGVEEADGIGVKGKEESDGIDPPDLVVEGERGVVGPRGGSIWREGTVVVVGIALEVVLLFFFFFRRFFVGISSTTVAITSCTFPLLIIMIILIRIRISRKNQIDYSSIL